jgi:hypothetical protein
MKLTPLVLSGSLVANVVLAVVLVSGNKSTPATPASVPLPARTDAAVPVPLPRPASSPALAAMPPLGSKDMKASDFAAIAAKLRAEGFPPEMIRNIIGLLVSRHFAEIGYATIRPKHNPVEYWKSPVVFATPEENAARRKLEREQETILREVLGPDFKLSEDRFAQLYHGISAPTVEKMKKIFSDYRELEEQIREQAGPRDDVAAKFQLLEKEKRADIERALTPAELHTFDLRNGAGAGRLRNHLGAFQPTEAEFLSLYPAFKAAAAAESGRPGQPITRETRRAQQAALDEEVRRVLGPQRFAEFEETRRR